MHKRHPRHPQKAFTIVELIIVIVIIAILATVIIVAYNGITKRSHESSLKSDLDNASKLLEMHKTLNNIYPQDLSNLKDVNQGQGFKPSGTNLITYHKVSNDKYCIDASFEDNLHYYITNNSEGAIQGNCEDAGQLVVVFGTMQNFTTAQCSALTTFTGANDEALINLTDNRGTSRTYTVGKLADNHCWMLDNLKLGSTTGTLTLTPADSNVGSNFTLPQLYNGSDSAYRDYDTPFTYGPVPGDTGTGATNYGYLYNWSAATAGESMTSWPSGPNDAPYSICPKGWSLPSGSETESDLYILDALFGGGATGQSNSPSMPSWAYTGSFRSVLSGSWYDGFVQQSAEFSFWSKSSRPGMGSLNSHKGFISPVNHDGYGNNYVNMGYIVNLRSYGNAIRCLLD